MASRNHLFVGHMFSNGITVLDVADPRAPKPVKFWEAPKNTRTHHLQTVGDLMLVVAGADIPTIGRYNPNVSYYEQSFAGGIKGKGDFTAGLIVFDIKDPANPRQIGFLDILGIGLNRLCYAGGKYAYLSAHMDGFTDHVLVVADVSDPTKPTIAGRWWIPGMNAAAGEKPSWTGRRFALHHMIVADGLGYAAWRDGGFTILDVKDVGNIKLLSHVNTNPPFPGGPHTPLPLPGRKLAAISTSPAASPDRGGSIWLHFRMEHRSSSHRLYALIRRDIQVRRNWPNALGHHTHSACVAIERIGKAPPGGSCYSEAPSGNFPSKNQDGATSRADASE